MMPHVAIALSTLFVALAAAMAAADDFDSDGVKIHYEVAGEGEPVVLVHGLGSTGVLNWKVPGIVLSLTARYRVIAIDCRGHGRSDKPETAGSYGGQMVEDLVHLLDHLKIAKAHVVGYSMGGMIVLKFVTRHPERVRSAVLGGMGMLRQGGVLQRVWENLPSREGAPVPEACIHELASLAVTEEEVNGIRIPVALVVGDRDPVRRLYVEPLLALRPDWPLRTVEGAGHINCILKEEFRHALREFLDRNAEPEKGK